eukprot:g7475.t1
MLEADFFWRRILLEENSNFNEDKNKACISCRWSIVLRVYNNVYKARKAEMGKTGKRKGENGISLQKQEKAFLTCWSSNPVNPPTKKTNNLQNSPSYFICATFQATCEAGHTRVLKATCSFGTKKQNRSMQVHDLRGALSKFFGHTQFKPGQEEAITALLAGRDVFLLASTGGGKSLAYQLPACLKPGVTVVLSPLLSLMQEQVLRLSQASPPIAAAMLGSTVPQAQKVSIVADLKSDKPSTKLLYCSPELLHVDAGLQAILQALHTRKLLSFFAVDECHCISAWGHDFRPSLKRLSCLKARFPDVPIIALTATATTMVREEVVRTLQLQRVRVVYVIKSFDRPNIRYVVVHKENCPGGFEKALIAFVKQNKNRTGIVYATTRLQAEDMAAGLKQEQVCADVYHAGLSAGQRKSTQEAWLAGKVQVMVATVAFGMGIDKQNVRFVVHCSLPKSLEAYYQESGRAGRDGRSAVALLFYSLEDYRRLDYLLQKDFNRTPTTEAHVTQRQKAQTTEAHVTQRQKAQVGMLSDMKGYAESDLCRRQLLLKYFGEDYQPASKSPAAKKKCCDACGDPARVKQKNAAAATVRQAYTGRKEHNAADPFGAAAFKKKQEAAKRKRPVEKGSVYEYDDAEREEEDSDNAANFGSALGGGYTRNRWKKDGFGWSDDEEENGTRAVRDTPRNNWSKEDEEDGLRARLYKRYKQGTTLKRTKEDGTDTQLPTTAELRTYKGFLLGVRLEKKIWGGE